MELTVKCSIEDAAKVCKAFNEGRLPKEVPDISIDEPGHNDRLQHKRQTRDAKPQKIKRR